MNYEHGNSLIFAFEWVCSVVNIGWLSFDILILQPTLSPQVGDIPRSNFHFDFDFERRVLAEAEKENQNWSRLGMENIPSKNEPTSSVVCFLLFRSLFCCWSLQHSCIYNVVGVRTWEEVYRFFFPIFLKISFHLLQ